MLQELQKILNKVTRCEFQEKGNLKEADFVINCCLFRKPHSRIDEYYNNFCKSLKLMQGGDFIIRLFYDKSVEDLVLKLRHPNLELVRYHFSDFYSSGYHQGTFGTLVRFLPLFASQKTVNVISDVDSFIDLEQIRKDIAKAKGYRFCGWVMDAFSGDRHTCDGKPTKIHILASLIKITHEPLDINIFCRFLRDIQNRSPRIMQWYKKNYNKKSRPTDGFFIYGIDEFFLNCYVFTKAESFLFKIFYWGIYDLHYRNVFLKPTAEIAKRVAKLLPNGKSKHPVQDLDKLIYKRRSRFDILQVDAQLLHKYYHILRQMIQDKVISASAADRKAIMDYFKFRKEDGIYFTRKW